MNENPEQPSLLITIADRRRIQKVEDIYESERQRIHYICLGRGTASSETLSMLGLGAIGNAVIFSFHPAPQAQRMMAKLTDKLELKKPGHGIAFTVPISGLSNSLMKLLKSADENNSQKEDDCKMDDLRNDIAYSLVVAVVNQGFSENAIAAAKQGGAKGGTVVHARRAGEGQTESFFGISINTEKEIVMILSPAEIKSEIMKSISQNCGSTTDAGGMVFSLPVDSAAGVVQKN